MGGASSRSPLDKWEIVQGIGTGAFGAVLAARKRRFRSPKHKQTDEDYKLYAIKCISKTEVLQREALEGTLAEFNIMAGMLKSLFVLQLHYAFQDAGTLYLVTDLCEGGSVDQLVRRESRLSEEHAIFLFAELILALEHLHSLGIVHMDVKLANCLLDIMGHLKLADFNGAVKFPSSVTKFDSKSYFGTSGYLVLGRLCSYPFNPLIVLKSSLLKFWSWRRDSLSAPQIGGVLVYVSGQCCMGRNLVLG